MNLNQQIARIRVVLGWIVKASKLGMVPKQKKPKAK